MILTLQPTVLRWARTRASFADAPALAGKLKLPVKTVQDWEKTGKLTMTQMQKLAQVTHTPEGYLFLREPPEEKLPVPDFRTLGSSKLQRPSPELLDILHDALRKQAWYREYLVGLGAEPVPFVGSIKLGQDVRKVADRMRQTMGLDTTLRSEAANWEEALRLQVERIESQGVLVLRNGVVASNNTRKLSVAEFRGFALADPYAPLIFLNNRDAPAAQMFTLTHELAHVWLGASGISNPEQTYADHNDIEHYCNQLAAELLVPAAELKQRSERLKDEADPVPALCRHFRVSSLVMLRRLKDIGLLDWTTFRKLYREQEQRFQRKDSSKEGGGDFYRTELVRVSPKFARALVESALEGRTPYRDACQMLGVGSVETIHKLAKHFEFTD